MALDIRLIPCLSDNYAVLFRVEESGAVVLVDAPEAAPIEAVLEQEGWRLTDILVTHKHDDHIAGIPALVKKHHPQVIAPAAEASKIPDVTKTVKQGDRFEVGGLAVEVFETPGHTAGHVSFFFPGEKLLFSGDTLFALGCGRLFEGSPAQMWHSLNKLRALPDDTQVYCGHEYTLSNARFALGIDPDNAALQARVREIETAREKGRPTIPFPLGLDKATNPFLRADQPAVAQGVGLAGGDPVAVFTEVRERKNRA